MKGPERPAGSKAAGRNKAGGAGPGGRSAAYPAPAWGQHNRGAKPKRWEWVPGPLDLRAEGLQTQTFIFPRKAESCLQSPRGVAAEDHRFLGFCWNGRHALLVLGAGGEREESHVLRFPCVLNVESGTFSSGFLHFAGVGIMEERPGVGWQGTGIPGTSREDRMG